MRGKLRDKRQATKRDTFKREVLERRRPLKRDARTSWLDQQAEDDDYEMDMESGADTDLEYSPKK
ncbi:hypothetical protein EPA93_41255 [Ktedonosporobacter rubrisoli]|uniref:Uncharacterized protein n=1 Tax=Ktedonosporobacter rubrisoli TaxID=2509675 RepID=A0A4P6K3J8_KTERU|nr:hypothetical protein [Ktedonosporobacter rubrisoli]QBD82066.1 hypothetical protein EPA93_41255 [Ktedonosporobacter rubrisoli]